VAVIPSAFEELARIAVTCRRCFEADAGLSPASVDIAQPRWVGPLYWRSSPRVLLLLLNPGGGGAAKREINLILAGKLHSFKDGKSDLGPVFEHYLQTIPRWGRPPGRFWSFYFDGLGLTLNSVALGNIAWCATSDNSYPQHMLERCFEAHTKPLLSVLDPNVVLLSGTTIHRYQRRISDLLPDAVVLPMLHFAHRKGKKAGKLELERVRAVIAPRSLGRMNVSDLES
jgi:hypothetical protein